MRILQVHNFYQQPGGEDLVFAEEGEMLEARGHHVVRYTAHNDEVDGMSRPALARATFWNRTRAQAVQTLIRTHGIELVHVHNTLPLISPAVYYAAQEAGAAVVQTLHNYRLMCPPSVLFRDGRVCEDCVGRSFAWPGVWHACYRDSRVTTAMVAAMMATHRGLGTWTRQVDRYIALTTFARDKFIEGGLPAEKIVVKPNFAREPAALGQGDGGYVLFVGRLAPEKGIATLLETWTRHQLPLPLRILGDGPMRGEVEAVANVNDGVQWLGHRPPEEVARLMGAAALQIVPSEWYETFGRVVIEAFAVGTPVVASNLGALAELIDPGRTGIVFEPGHAAGLASAVTRLVEDPHRLKEMRLQARSRYEALYTEASNYERLVEIYQEALLVKRRKRV